MDRELNPAEDLENVAELMAAEREKEITQATTMQGQIVALVMMLREKGLFSQEDVDEWERRSDSVQKVLVKLLQAQEELERAEEEEDCYRATAKALDLSIKFSIMLGNTEEHLAPMRRHLDEVVDLLAKMEHPEDDQPAQTD